MWPERASDARTLFPELAPTRIELVRDPLRFHEIAAEHGDEILLDIEQVEDGFTWHRFEVAVLAAGGVA